MDAQQFDRLTLQFGHALSRRRFGAALAVLALAPGWHRQQEQARRRQKPQKRKPTFVHTEIVGGHPVPAGDNTFMALLRIQVGASQFRCGGSLIDPRFVLTAAHCVTDSAGTPRDPGALTIFLGKGNVNNFGPTDERAVTNVIPHPDWDPTTSNGNDVALLKLSQPVPGSIAQTLEFVGSGDTRFDGAGQPVSTAGWGTTAEGGSLSDQLLEADLNIVSDTTCGQIYPTSFEAGVMICAEFAGRDSCQGDSGGPLFVKDVVDAASKKVNTEGKKKKKCKPACTGGAKCLNRKCVCPAGQEFCNAICTLSDRVCEEFCCPVDVACFTGGCACEEFLCRCDEALTYCSTPDFTQCCLPEDACDPLAACTTDTCAAGNDVCALGAAFCGGDALCLCATPTDESVDPFCADFAALENCPAESACATNDDCGEGETCANVPCCGDDPDAFFGVCLLPCPMQRAARASTTDRASRRLRLARALNQDVTWSRPRSGPERG